MCPKWEWTEVLGCGLLLEGGKVGLLRVCPKWEWTEVLGCGLSCRSAAGLYAVGLFCLCAFGIVCRPFVDS